MERHAEIGIVGAGPAGSRAAELFALQGASVVLFDPRVPWEKPCGGGLTPPLLGEIPDLEELDPVASRHERAWIETDGRRGIEVLLSSPIRVVSRTVLATWGLDRALRAGAVHRDVKIASIERTTAGWLLHADDETWSTSYLVGADGAASTVRRAVAPSMAVQLVPARVAYPGTVDDVSTHLVLRFYRDVAGYLWDFPRPDRRSVGIEVTRGPRTRAELDERIDEFMTEASGEDALTSHGRAGAVIGTPSPEHGSFDSIAGRRFALVGDAAGLADPFTGEGIRNAFRSATLLARARLETPESWPLAYPALVRSRLGPEFVMAGRLRRWLSDSGLGVRLVERAVTSDVAYGLAAAILESVMWQDYGASSVLDRWRRAVSEARRRPPRRGIRPVERTGST